MRAIKSKDTKPEMIVRKYLFSKGFRYRLHDNRFPGKPDIYLPKYNTVIFVHGCFWHNHNNCSRSNIPKSNVNYWKAKLQNNIDRDKRNINELRKSGFKVLLVWECQLISTNKMKFLRNIDKKIKNVKI